MCNIKVTFGAFSSRVHSEDSIRVRCDEAAVVGMRVSTTAASSYLTRMESLEWTRVNMTPNVKP